jgi:hypothetical protein
MSGKELSMRNLSRMTLVVGVFVGSGAAASLTMVGCSGDDTVVPGPDASGDVTLDGNPDVVSTDGAPDVKSDVIIPITDGGMAVKDYAALEATALCKRLATCCFGADASAFDSTKCINVVGKNGWEGSLSEYLDPTVDQKNLVVEEPSATACINGVSAFACPSITDTELTSLAKTCHQAMHGILKQGAGCNGSIECGPGLFCRPGAFDGGTADAGDAAAPKGACVPLLAANAPCSVGESQNDGCMYRGYLGAPPLSCLVVTDGGSPVCAQKSALGTDCNYNWECATGLCDENYLCAHNYTLVTQGLCTALTK